MASDRGKLIPVLLEPLSVHQFPLGLYSRQAANLSNWEADLEHEGWRKLRGECEAKMMPPWAQRQIDEKEASLVGERARRESAERRDKILQAQIAKEAQVQQGCKGVLGRGLRAMAAAKATIEGLTRARSEAETRYAQLQQDMKRERDSACEELVALKTTVETQAHETEALRATVQ